MLLHDEVMFILTGIVFFVLWVLIKALMASNYSRYLFEGVIVEII